MLEDGGQGMLLQPSPGARVDATHTSAMARTEKVLLWTTSKGILRMTLPLSFPWTQFLTASLEYCVFSHRKEDQKTHAKRYTACYSFYCYKPTLYQTRKPWYKAVIYCQSFSFLLHILLFQKHHKILLFQSSLTARLFTLIRNAGAIIVSPLMYFNTNNPALKQR